MTAAIASLLTPCCVAIRSGGFPLVLFWKDPIVCPEGRDSLALTVEGYEAPAGKEAPASKVVKIVLWRVGSSSLRDPAALRRAGFTPLYVLVENNARLTGMPELEWSEV